MASAGKKIRVPSAPAVHRLIFLVFDIPFSNSFYRRVYLILRKVSRSAAVSFDGAGSRPFNASASASSGCFLLIRFRTNIHARATASKHQITEEKQDKNNFFIESPPGKAATGYQRNRISFSEGPQGTASLIRNKYCRSCI